jgi:hypothetical protein
MPLTELCISYILMRVRQETIALRPPVVERSSGVEACREGTEQDTYATKYLRHLTYDLSRLPHCSIHTRQMLSYPEP